MASPPPAMIMVPQSLNLVYQQTTPHVPNAQEPFRVLKKGQPKALGATQLVLAFSQIALGAVGIFLSYYGFTLSIFSGINFWGAVFYIISGSLSVAVENNPSYSLVQGFLAMNIISCLISFLATCFFITDACISNTKYYQGQKITNMIFLILSSVLEFCVCISLSIFGCKSLNQDFSSQAQVLVIQNDYRIPGPNFVPTFGNPPSYSMAASNDAVVNHSPGINTSTYPVPMPEPAILKN
ncbi:membrane-spanning 4-domains subfamily A member 15-like [Pelobates fuscus]|uniref:membrane-spanning 4-domains subfamily A member 15-like n=1 Tax=Pelobates fuscus TaxID=191477 RepID=UPI002FE4A899